MGLRFRRSIKLLPGVRLNVSRSGFSTSIGTRGAHVTVGHGQVRETVGIPGTGLSYTQVHNTGQSRDIGRAAGGVGAGAVVAAVLVVIVIIAAGGSILYGLVA